MDDVSFWGALTKVEIVAQETFFNQIFDYFLLASFSDRHVGRYSIRCCFILVFYQLSFYILFGILS